MPPCDLDLVMPYAANKNVSILVLVDAALRRADVPMIVDLTRVSILVLVDAALRL